MNHETLGSRIRAKRIEHGMSQERLAGEVGLTTQAINRIELGIIQAPMIADYLPKIAAELGVTVEALASGELRSEQETRRLLRRLKDKGVIRSGAELKAVEEVATETLKKRSNVNIPLNEEEILILIEVIRGADGL